MSTIAYTNPQAQAPTVSAPWPGPAGAEIRHTVRRAALLPMAVSLAVQWVYFVAYWIPETEALPARAWWLTQLAPLGVTAGGPGGLVLLLCAVAVAVMSRTPHWLARTGMLLPAGIGTVTALLSVLVLLLTGRAGLTGLGIILLGVWVAAAAYAAFHSVLVGVGAVPPRTGRTALVPLLLWILLLPGPLALGRSLLAPDLRTAAAELQRNTVALQLAGLHTGVSVRLYVFGVLLAVVAYLVFQLWPARDAWRHRVKPLRWYVGLLLALLVLANQWWTVQTPAAKRVTELRYGSPAAELRFSCATWTFPAGPQDPVNQPVRTVAVTGFGCRDVTVFAGFRQLGTGSHGVTVSPVAMRGLESLSEADPVPQELVGARYGDVLVLAGSDRWDHHADQLVAVRMTDGAERWHFTCADQGEVRAFFAGGLVGLDPADQRLVPGDPLVTATCDGRRVRFDPNSG